MNCTGCEKTAWSYLRPTFFLQINKFLEVRELHFSKFGSGLDFLYGMDNICPIFHSLVVDKNNFWAKVDF